MREAWGSAEELLVRITVGGGLLLLICWMLMRHTRQPARQQRLGEWSMAAALILAVLSLGPSWLIISIPSWVELGGWSSLVPPLSKAEGMRASHILSPDPDPHIDSEFSPQIVLHLWPTEVGQTFLPASIQSLPVVPVDRALIRQTADAALIDDELAEPGSWAAFAMVARWFEPQLLTTTLIGLWAFGAVLLLGRCMIGYLGLWHLLRHSEPAPAWVADLLTRMTCGNRPVRLRVSARVRAPLSWGLIRPTIVLPADLCRTAETATLEWVFAHELTHLERGDAWTALLFALGQTLYYFLPFYWWVRRRVRLCQEYIADAAAVAGHRRPADYAQFLLTLTAAPPLPVGATGIAGQSSDLYRRVSMLLQGPVAVEKRCPRRCSAAVAALLLCVAVIVSGIGLRAEPSPAPDIAAAELVPTPVFEALPLETTPTSTPRSEDKPGVLAPQQETSANDDPGRRPAQRPGSPPKMSGSQKGPERSREGMNRVMGWPRIDSRKSMSQPRMTFGVPGQFGPTGFREDERRLGVRLDRPNQSQVDRLGLQKGQGLIVETVQPFSAAARAGIRHDDVLLELNGKPVSSDFRRFERMVEQIKARTPVQVVVLRKGQKETISSLVLPPELRPSSGFRPPSFGYPFPFHRWPGGESAERG